MPLVIRVNRQITPVAPPPTSVVVAVSPSSAPVAGTTVWRNADGLTTSCPTTQAYYPYPSQIIMISGAHLVSR